jgi:hypothetical protein
MPQAFVDVYRCLSGGEARFMTVERPCASDIAAITRVAVWRIRSHDTVAEYF